MIYKIEVGMELDFIRKNKVTKTEEVRTVTVLEMPNANHEKVQVMYNDTHAISYFWLESLKQCRRHVSKNVKQKSAMSYALDILTQENRPIHIDELCELIFEKGYTLPREGKTFKNTISTTLNSECDKPFPKIKKVHYGTYAKIDCDVPYVKSFSKKVKEDFDQVFA